MSDKIRYLESVSCEVIKPQSFNLKGKFKFELIRNGQIIETIEIENTVVNQGKNDLLEVGFNAGTQRTVWYFGLMDNAGYASNPVTDTMSSHAGWAEWASYTEADRQEWTTGSAASQSITNAIPATFNISASGTLKGIFVTTSNIKSGTAGILWSTVLFATTVPVVNTDQVKITYTLST